jgi:hypothetical protein
MQAYDNLALVTQVIQQVFSDDAEPTVERVEAGVSTAVYRVAWDATVVYVRVLPEQGASFAPEAAVHRRLLARGLHVPEVLYVEPLNPPLQRSVMVTTAIAGQAIGEAPRPANIASIARGGA